MIEDEIIFDFSDIEEEPNTDLEDTLDLTEVIELINSEGEQDGI